MPPRHLRTNRPELSDAEDEPDKSTRISPPRVTNPTQSVNIQQFKKDYLTKKNFLILMVSVGFLGLVILCWLWYMYYVLSEFDDKLSHLEESLQDYKKETDERLKVLIGNVSIKHISKEIEGLNERIDNISTSLQIITNEIVAIENTLNLWTQNFTKAEDFLLQIKENTILVQESVLKSAKEAEHFKVTVDTILKKEEKMEAYKISLRDKEEYLNYYLRLEENQANVSGELIKLERRHKEMVKKLDDMNTSATEIKNNFSGNLTKLKDLSLSLKTQFSSLFNDTSSESKSMLESVKSEKSSALDMVKELSLTTSQHNTTVFEVKEKLDGLQSTLTSCIEHVADVTKTLFEDKETDAISDMETVYKYMSFLGVLVTLLVFISSTVFSICCMSARSNRKTIYELEEKVNILVSVIHIKDEPLMKFESMRILHNLKSGNWQSLKNKYCIVSFNPNNVAVHERYIDPCLAGRSRVLGYEKETFVVNYPKDVLKMPRCKVMLVFVDNNCDDIILERPGKETGDLRLLTVKACQKMNADVFVIYIGDQGSGTLMPRLLYSPQIAAVTEHFLLKEMEKDDRVMTCFRELTVDQREKISEQIN